MLIAFLIMLREGFEAALIVGIIGGYIVQTGRASSLPSLWLGVAAAAIACLALGLAITWTGAEFPQAEQEIFAGIVGLIAVCMLVTMVFWMRRAGRSIKKEIQDKVEATFSNASSRWNWGLALTAFLITGREGVEAVVFLIATIQQGSGFAVPLGAALGLAAAAVLGYGVFLGGMKLNMRRFFRWTGAFIILVAGGLLAGSLVHFHEGGVWNLFQDTAFDLSGILPSDSLPGILLGGMFGYRDAPTYGEIGAFLLFTIPALILFLMPQGDAPAAVKSNPST